MECVELKDLKGLECTHIATLTVAHFQPLFALKDVDPQRIGRVRSTRWPLIEVEKHPPIRPWLERLCDVYLDVDAFPELPTFKTLRLPLVLRLRVQVRETTQQ
jgi:hypothetical protein